MSHALNKARALYRLFTDRLKAPDGDGEALAAMRGIITHLRKYGLTLEQVVPAAPPRSTVALDVEYISSLLRNIRDLDDEIARLKVELDTANKDQARVTRQREREIALATEERIRRAAAQVEENATECLSGSHYEPLVELIRGLFVAVFAFGPKQREVMTRAAIDAVPTFMATEKRRTA